MLFLYGEREQANGIWASFLISSTLPEQYNKLFFYLFLSSPLLYEGMKKKNITHSLIFLKKKNKKKKLIANTMNAKKMSNFIAFFNYYFNL